MHETMGKMTDADLYHGNAEWLLGEQHGLTDDQVRCLNVLCSIHRIYNLVGHLAGRDLEKFHFAPGGGVMVRMRGSISSFDDDRLTRLTLTAHRLCCRVEISAYSNMTFQIYVTPREPTGTSVFDRHPTVESVLDWLDQPPAEDTTP